MKRFHYFVISLFFGIQWGGGGGGGGVGNQSNHRNVPGNFATRLYWHITSTIIYAKDKSIPIKSVYA